MKTLKETFYRKLQKSAHQLVTSAIKGGALKKQPCERCGKNPAVAHHEDYTKPLDVMWLCHKHHYERHKLIGRAFSDPNQTPYYKPIDASVPHFNPRKNNEQLAQLLCSRMNLQIKVTKI